jgi:hypothetical protein
MIEAIVMSAAMMLPADADVPTTNYRGVHYAKKWEPFRKCVVKRESKGDYQARNPRSSAAGAYQFLANKWRDSLVWMLLPEFGANVRILNTVPLHKWPALYQDAAFFTVVATQNGWRHWYYSGSPCNRLAVR